MYVEKLTDYQIKQLEQGFSKTFFDGADVKIVNNYGEDFLTMFVDNKWYTMFEDFNLTKYNEDMFVAYCSYMASIFKDEYVADSKKYLCQRIKEDSASMNDSARESGEINKSRFKDLKFHAEVLTKLDEEYNSILNKRKTEIETL